MEEVIIYSSLVLVGLCLGSFGGAMVWRLRARQLSYDKNHGDPYDHHEYARLKKLTESRVSNDRSRCLDCDYTLRWYDLIPLISWLTLRGRCRNCRRSIGRLEPLIELGVAIFFVVSYILWPYDLSSTIDIARFVIWLASGTGLAILFAYDAKWFLLPDRVSFTVIGLGAISSVLVVLQSTDITATVMSIAGSVLILSGIYYVLHRISDGRWIGFGDVKLGLGLALLLADWQLAFIALFAANLVGCLVVIPQLLRGKLSRNAHVPFGPLLIVGLVVAQLAGPYLVETYLLTLM